MPPLPLDINPLSRGYERRIRRSSSNRMILTLRVRGESESGRLPRSWNSPRPLGNTCACGTFSGNQSGWSATSVSRKQRSFAVLSAQRSHLAGSAAIVRQQVAGRFEFEAWSARLASQVTATMWRSLPSGRITRNSNSATTRPENAAAICSRTAIRSSR